MFCPLLFVEQYQYINSYYANTIPFVRSGALCRQLEQLNRHKTFPGWMALKACKAGFSFIMISFVQFVMFVTVI